MVWPIKDWDSAMGRDVRWAFSASQRTRRRVAFISSRKPRARGQHFDAYQPEKSLCSGLATDHFLQIFRVASPLHGDLRAGALNFAKIVGRERDRNCSKVFFEARRL